MKKDVGARLRNAESSNIPLARNAGKRMQPEGQDGEDFMMTLRADIDSLMRNICDAKTVQRVAAEAWSEHQSFSGVLDLLDHKLAMIESSTRSLLENAEKGAGHERPSRSTL